MRIVIDQGNVDLSVPRSHALGLLNTPMAEAILVSDRFRSQVTAEKRENGGLVLWGPRSMIVLSRSELDRLIEFANDTPRLGQLATFPMAPRTAPECPESD
jgi:hypothetical protein